MTYYQKLQQQIVIVSICVICDPDYNFKDRNFTICAKFNQCPAQMLLQFSRFNFIFKCKNDAEIIKLLQAVALWNKRKIWNFILFLWEVICMRRKTNDVVTTQSIFYIWYLTNN